MSRWESFTSFLRRICLCPFPHSQRSSSSSLSLYEIDKQSIEEVKNAGNLNDTNDEGLTLLMMACMQGNYDIVEFLLISGVQVNKITDIYGETALTLASSSGEIDIADMLIKAGAKIDIGYYTPIMEATLAGKLEMVIYLIKAGADINIISDSGESALHMADKCGFPNIVRYLVQAGAYMNLQTTDGDTPLIKAAKHGHFSCVKLLVANGAEVEIKNKVGLNANRYALSKGYEDIVSYLNENGSKEAVEKMESTSSTHMNALNTEERYINIFELSDYSSEEIKEIMILKNHDYRTIVRELIYTRNELSKLIARLNSKECELEKLKQVYRGYLKRNPLKEYLNSLKLEIRFLKKRENPLKGSSKALQISAKSSRLLRNIVYEHFQKMIY